MHGYWEPLANPHRPEQAVAFALLVLGMLAWVRVRPTPSWLTAAYMMVGSAVTILVTTVQTCGVIEAPRETTWLITQATFALATGIYVELFRTVRQRREALAAMRVVSVAIDQTRRNSSE
jgi:hypothetical protein